MLKSVNQQDNIAAERLLEFLAPDPAWNRSLWSIGLCLGLSELHEACTVARTGTLSEAAVRRVCSVLTLRAGKDPALTKAEKTFLVSQIKEAPRADSPAHHGIAEMAALLARDYLERWAAVVRGPGFTVEHFARSIASHLLDAGFSASHLHAFIRQRLRSEEPVTLAALCEALHAEMRSNPSRPFEVLLAYARPPKLAGGIPKHWLWSKDIAQWLTANGFSTSGVRPSVGFVLTVHARDFAGAAQAAREESDRFAARALIATGLPLERLPHLWVKGAQAPARQNGDSRGVRVEALYREDRVFSASSSSNVDAAIELLSHLEASSPTAAIAGGWGAIEGLLADPGDRATAADNLASLVACSFLRAELTTLSYKAEREHAEVRDQLKLFNSNRERSRVIASLILDNRLPTLRSLDDQAAVMRVKKVLDNPSPELQTIRSAIAEAFHRLYRQRNLILHGGKIDSVTLTASLRTVAKLAGAGMDRITHGQYVQTLRPLELVARANLSIALISRDKALSCVDLLEMH